MLIQSVSLLNRLITTSPITSGQSFMYSLLVKSISQQSSHSATSVDSGAESMSSATDEIIGARSAVSDSITKNNQFLVQLNLMMSQAVSATSNSQSATISASNGSTTTSSTSDIDWFHLLVKLAKHKSASIMDCMLFSLFSKIAQLTPRLFGSLLGSAQCVAQMHQIVIDKLSGCSNGDQKPVVVVIGRGQLIASVCEFLCALIEFQPGYFRSLVALKRTELTANSTTTNANDSVVQVDESSSVLKVLFSLLNELKSHKVCSIFVFCIIKVNNYNKSITHKES
jgi:hypothetical protein